MEPKKHWLRWTQKTKEFPKPKYRFTELLKHKGDMLETFPMSKEDGVRFRDAAKFWAYTHKKRVRCITIPAPNDMVIKRVTLVELHRKRERDY